MMFVFMKPLKLKTHLDRLILPKGKIVDQNFKIPNPSTPTADLNPVVSVSNYVYEVRENDKKRQIFVLKPEYLGMFLEDMRNEMKYGRSSEYISSNVAATRNTRNTSAE